MKRIHLWLALALLVAVNAVVLAGVARNRSGRPDAEATLTERELPLQIDYRHQENSGLSLGLDWRRDFVQEWFDVAKLTELGFAPRPGKEDPSEWELRRPELPKKVFVVLEYEGPAWRRYREQKQKELARLAEGAPGTGDKAKQRENRRAAIEKDLLTSSRLFAVDAGRDPAQLRTRYPDGARYLIVPALVRMTYEVEKKVVTPQGYISRLLVRELHLSRDLAAPLGALRTKGRLRFGSRFYEPWEKHAPRYEVTVWWGRRHEPWVVGVRLIQGTPPLPGPQKQR